MDNQEVIKVLSKPDGVRVGDIPELCTFSDGTARSNIYPLVRNKDLRVLMKKMLQHPEQLVYENSLRESLQAVEDVGHASAMLRTLVGEQHYHRWSTSSRFATMTLPTAIDLRNYTPSVAHQGLAADCLFQSLQCVMATSLTYAVFGDRHTLAPTKTFTTQGHFKDLSFTCSTDGCSLATTALTARRFADLVRPSRIFMSYAYKRLFCPSSDYVNIASQAAIDPEDAIVSTICLPPCFEMHYRHPAALQTFLVDELTDKQVEEWYLKCFFPPDSLAVQLGQRGPYQRMVYVRLSSDGGTPSKTVLDGMKRWLSVGHPILLRVPNPQVIDIFHHETVFDDQQDGDGSGSGGGAASSALAMGQYDHAVCVVGYDDNKQVEGKRGGNKASRKRSSSGGGGGAHTFRGCLVIRDSYGTDVAEKGHWYLPYEVFERMLNHFPHMHRGLGTLASPYTIGATAFETCPW